MARPWPDVLPIAEARAGFDDRPLPEPSLRQLAERRDLPKPDRLRAEVHGDPLESYALFREQNRWPAKPVAHHPQASGPFASTCGRMQLHADLNAAA
jgi:hypothetical protein